MFIPFIPHPRALAAFAATTTLALTGCGGGGGDGGAAPFAPLPITQQSCASMGGLSIPASEIAVANAGATVKSATLVKATDSGNANGDFCKVLGSFKAIDPAAPVINFEVNLPVTWNGKLVQEGGGGFDGTLVTGLDPLNFTAATAPTPVALGYVTMGDDAGHVGGVTDGSFAANDEALFNYGRLSLKKTHDATIALMKRLYQVAVPRKTYFIGSSTGGRDGLSAIQNWPDDYDAIFINRPALNYTGLRLANNQLGRSVFLNNGAGWLNPAKTRLLLDTVMASCDALDGVQDGIISNLPSCKAKGDATLVALRCANGADTGDSCLSDPQLATVRTMASPIKLSYPLANGVTQYGGYNLLAGTVFGPPYSAARNFGPSPAAPAAPNFLAVGSGTGANAPNAYVTGDQWMKYFITRNASFNTLTVDPVNPGVWQARIQAISAQTDAASTDLDRFILKGGRIVWTHGSADEVVSTDSSIDYYNQLVARYGPAKVDEFVRFYLIYGNGHGDTGPFLPQFDSLKILSNWVENAVDPANTLVATNTRTAKDATDKSPAATTARPLCRYPQYPKYNGGSANPALATSFTCSL
ncbi:MAG: tannase/feruloyl esterase family alpha/beta hydrolase [Pseudomonadota bacterium]